MHRRLLPLLPLSLLLTGANAPGYERGEVTLRLNTDRSAEVEVYLSGASDGVAHESLLVPNAALVDWRVLTPDTQPAIQGTQNFGFQWLGPPESHARVAFRLPEAVIYEGGHNHLDLSWMNGWQVPVGSWQTRVMFPPEQVPGAIWLDDDYSPGAELFTWRGRPSETLKFGYWPLGEPHNEQRLPQNLHYLLLWAGLTPSFYALARYQGRRPRRPLIPPSAIEVAYLEGGGQRALATALLHLAAIGAVQATGTHWQGNLSESELANLPPVPRRAYRLAIRPEATVREILLSTVVQQDAAALAEEALIKKGFLPSPADVGRLGSLRMAAVIGLLAMAIGILLTSYWDVHLSAGAWTSTTLGIALNLGWLLYGENQMQRTSDGRRWLIMNRKLASGRLQVSDRSTLKDDAVQMDVAFFGPAVLEGSSFAYLGPTLAESAT